MTTLYDRINTLLLLDAKRNLPGTPQDQYRDASGSIADNGLAIINELTERLEKAHQLFQDLDDLEYIDEESEKAAAIDAGMAVTDIVAYYKVDRAKLEYEA